MANDMENSEGDRTEYNREVLNMTESGAVQRLHAYKVGRAARRAKQLAFEFCAICLSSRVPAPRINRIHFVQNSDFGMTSTR